MNHIDLSIVIPTHKENDDSYLLKIAASYPQNPNIEYIVVDYQTPNEWFKKIKRNDFKILSTQASTRAERMNLGFKKTNGDIVLFHHPRSWIDKEAIEYLISNKNNLSWGGFTHEFDQTHIGLKFTSWYSNHIRPRVSKILYLDHCIFFRTHLLNQDIPNIAIFEDTELSKILRESGGPPRILPFPSVTSSIRFKKNGFLKQAWINQLMKIKHHLGFSHRKMNDDYEKNLNLNG